MTRLPAIPHKDVVDYILSGKTTSDARLHFNFATDNIANLRVHAAFKVLGISRPRYSENRNCEFCNVTFTARDKKQRTCGSTSCQTALINSWQRSNKNKVVAALASYRRSLKGRANNLRMHASRRHRGKTGTVVERWNYAAAEARKRLRKLRSLHTRNPWEYRINHIQKMSGLARTFSPRRLRNVGGSRQQGWHLALRAVQTTLSQQSARQQDSSWESAISRIASAIKSGHRIRTWNKKKR